MKKWIYIIGILIIFIDRIAKIFVINFLELGKSITLIPNFLYITYIKNDGAAWGLFGGKIIFLILMAIIALIFIVNMINKMVKIKKLDIISYGLVIGGIVGNLIDRIIYQEVIDFVDIYIFTYDYPIFNISDMAIVIGVILVVIDIFRGGDINIENTSS